MIGVKGDEPIHHITNMVDSIESFAGLNGNPSLEKECEDYRNEIVSNYKKSLES